ncbi:hypothetical protein KSS87_015047 [Heliosperma pusillum]|nr:hypothetical protein KSS87_015047 [Heliosperma pusillum]
MSPKIRTPIHMAAGKRSKNGGKTSMWLAQNPSKRWAELFFLLYTPFWLTLCLGIVVPFKLYENFRELEYLLVAMISAIPSFVIPMFFVGKADKGVPLKDRYWVKVCYLVIIVIISDVPMHNSPPRFPGNMSHRPQFRFFNHRPVVRYIIVEYYWSVASLWIILFSYVGNYFWTHYFFKVLGASYTFPSWKMNDVPHTTFLLTHVCFLFYHVASNMTLRRLRYALADVPEKIRWCIEGAWILALSYFIAYLETIAIANFPYYEFVDREAMYKVGCLFYAIYFVVSFPMFLRIDEKPGDKWDLARVAVDALGAAMLVTIILDLWRIFLGPIVPVSDTQQCAQAGLPWFADHVNTT